MAKTDTRGEAVRLLMRQGGSLPAHIRAILLVLAPAVLPNVGNPASLTVAEQPGKVPMAEIRRLTAGGVMPYAMILGIRGTAPA